jgi:exonuclease SbcC
MKFKKVKIQAFRAYNRVEDGTFDFNIPEDANGGVADFVSIYAPNGFGKTSFYDAVEYGITDSISRFLTNLKMNKDAAKSERSIATGGKGQNILRNRFAADDLSTEIKIYTTSGSEPIEKKIAKTNRKNATDFDFDEDKVKNKYFQSVILSQEWIDAFLKVDDPSDRYIKFIEYFGDTNIDEYYKKLIELITLNDKRIDEIKKNLNGIQTELDFSGDKDVLKKTNEKILELIALGETLDTITNSFSDKESLNLSNKISERLSDLEYDKQKQVGGTEYIDLVFAGSEDKKGIEAYFDSKNRYTELKEKERILKDNLNRFELRKKQLIEIGNNSTSIEKAILEKEQVESVRKLYPEYTRIQNEINAKEQERDKVKKESSDIENTISKLKFTETELTARINNLTQQISITEKQLKDLPELLSNYNSNTPKIEELQKKISQENDKCKTTDNKINELKSVGLSLQSAINELKINQYPSPFEKEFMPFKDIIEAVTNCEVELRSKNEDVIKVNNRIKEQEEFNSDIAKYISKGAEIIDNNQSSTCPLCSHEYESYQELAQKVASNSFLTNALSASLEERGLLEIQIHTLKERFETAVETLLKSITEALKVNTTKLTELRDELSKYKQAKEALEKDHNKLNESIQGYLSVLQGVNHKEYETGIDVVLNNLKLDLAKVSENSRQSLEQINAETLKSTVLIDKIELLNKEILALSDNQERKNVIEYFKKTFPSSKVEASLLDTKIAEVEKIIAEIKAKNEELTKVIHDSEEALKSSNEESDKKELELIQKSQELVQQVTVSFEQEITSQLNIKLDDIDKDSLIEQLNKLRSASKAQVEEQDKKIKNYNLLLELKKNVEPFLKYEEAKKTESGLKQRKKKLEEDVRAALETERDRVTGYLDNQIKSFFYQDLINDLYRRIDPHPDYKKIKFICDFKDDKPKLNICLYKDNDEDNLIIPNLYFSTAQLNILSLSIFLAKALNAKNDEGQAIDCIFIDDPIQSMDSINILSTIDLFRSLVINEKKQIILSTHDENFHNLLKKKMPSKLFKSKFMELESFGKVKQE